MYIFRVRFTFVGHTLEFYLLENTPPYVSNIINVPYLYITEWLSGGIKVWVLLINIYLMWKTQKKKNQKTGTVHALHFFALYLNSYIEGGVLQIIINKLRVEYHKYERRNYH